MRTVAAKNNADVLIVLIFFLGFIFLNNADVEKLGSFKSFGFIYIYRLVANLHIAHNNFFKVVSLNLFFAIWILDYNLTKSSVFYNYIFIL